MSALPRRSSGVGERQPCAFDPEDRSACDQTGPPQVRRVLVVDGVPWLYTTESLQRFDPQTFAAGQIVALRPLYD